jgi:hypothetical protein
MIANSNPGRESPQPGPQVRGTIVARRSLPREVRKEITAFALTLKRQYRKVFTSNPPYRKSAGQLLTALLPPKPRRRGRPGRPDVTKAIRLRREFRRRFPNEQWPKIWERIYPAVIPGYCAMDEVWQRNAGQVLRESVRWRQSAERRYATKGNPPMTTHRTPKPQARMASTTTQ